MNKLTASIISILTLVSIATRAQSKLPSHKLRVTSFHFFVGGGFGKEDGSRFLTEGQKNRFSYTAGAGITTGISNKFDLSLDFLYESKGFNQELASSAPEGIFDIPSTPNNPSVPTQLSYKNQKTYYTIRLIPQFKIGRFVRLGVGPYASWLIVYRNETRIYQSGRKRLDQYLNQKGGNTKYDFGFSCSGTYDFKIGKLQMFAGLIANIGLYNVAARYLDQGVKERMEAYYAQVGIRIPR